MGLFFNKIRENATPWGFSKTAEFFIFELIAIGFTTLATAAHKIADFATMTGLTELSKISMQLKRQARIADVERLFTLMCLYNKHCKN